MKSIFFLTIFLVICVSVNVFGEEDFEKTPLQILHISTIDDIEEFKALHPGTHVEQLEQNFQYRDQINYFLGARIAGDRLVATSSKNQHWPRPQNAAVTLTYPAQGVGATVSYVSINVTQSNHLGQAYVLRGGIHQRAISIVVESYNTIIMNYICNIYGY